MTKWPLDGKSHSNVDTNVILKTKRIDAFLQNSDRQILVATKGMGKTLLLRVKKKMIEDEKSGSLIIPQSREYDEPKFTGTLSSKKVIRSLESWRSLWEVCITFSIFSYSKFGKKDEFDDEIKIMIDNFELPRAISEYILVGILKSQRIDPSYFLNKFITECTIQKLEQFLRNTSDVYRLSNRFITNSVCVFIDAFDQTLSDNFKEDIEIWKNGQLGLVKSVHKLHSYNPHIKVYTSIRQEAFAGFLDEQKSVIRGLSTILEYSQSDLKSIFELSIKQYTGLNSIEEFIGFKQVTNSFCNQEEDVFEYIYRHSTYTPRSIMKFGREIDESSDTKTELEFKKIINKTGSENIIDDYLSTEKIFLMNYIKSTKNLFSILSLIPSNVLNGKMIESIKNQFAGNNGFTQEDCHPFCELYNIGLIGKVNRSTVSNGNITQVFKKPHEFDWQHYHITGNSEKDIYLVHPSLYDSIINSRDFYLINSDVVIGDGNTWSKNIKPFPSIFLSHSSKDKVVLEAYFIYEFQKVLSTYIPFDIWFDDMKITAGDNIPDLVKKGVDNSNYILLCISENSLQSGWVTDECDIMLKKNKEGIIPFIIDNTKVEDLPIIFKDIKVEVLSDGNWDRAIKDLAISIAQKIAPKF